MSEIPLERRSYKKLWIILIIVVVSIISLIFMAIGFNWFGTPSDGDGG
jgi:hypothetical protein